MECIKDRKIKFRWNGQKRHHSEGNSKLSSKKMKECHEAVLLYFYHSGFMFHKIPQFISLSYAATFSEHANFFFTPETLPRMLFLKIC